ncbi:MAG: hypothetical protein COU81_02300 [Candidatus Portnoybacteria bacterium CG10_big_fil_rev_8_21_14_0_10_36_7]|uniref:Glycosyltransferase RgtA/B/C/D-like domain-containing protein n=1 Tax=Candidatus Portnoybacteria bacterium CG10_big_fil_rev_8_21_14_0_10_36_7 TaxID=1974812 RepID=A0A2M8KE04_9BACT|nr:MAG: hypothetical protein COU81_02300 [Candidatus Portnoybacteria bacterium CG10_big_fil_rev_8_21_14_0_10_36_7]
MLLATVILGFSRLGTILKYGESGLGYDTGFYRRYLQLPVDSIPRPESLLLGPETTASRSFLDFFSLIGLSPNQIIYGVYFILHWILGLLLYFLAKKSFGRNAGIATFFIFALSPVQFFSFWFVFLKQSIALIWLFLSLYLLEQDSLTFFIPLILTFFSHRTTTIITAFSAIPYALYTSFKLNGAKKIYTVIGAITIGIIIWLLNGQVIIEIIQLLKNGLTGGDLYSLRTGQFISLSQFLAFVSPYIPLSIAGLYVTIKNKRFNGIFFFTITVLLLVLLRSFFYLRLLVFLDLGIIFYAGVGTSFLITNLKNQKTAILITSVWCLTLTIILANVVITLRPIISQEDLREINKISSLPTDSLVMTESSIYAPWLVGWAGTYKRIISPGILWDEWNLEKWNVYWNATTEEQIKLLSEYKKAIYIFKPNNDYSQNKCFTKFNDLTYKFICY